MQDVVRTGDANPELEAARPPKESVHNSSKSIGKLFLHVLKGLKDYKRL